jgi:hypothetical protein
MATAAASMAAALRETTMDESWLSTVFGSVVLIVAAMFVVVHYRREHRRAHLLRRLDGTRHRFRS